MSSTHQRFLTTSLAPRALPQTSATQISTITGADVLFPAPRCVFSPPFKNRELVLPTGAGLTADWSSGPPVLSAVEEIGTLWP